MHVPSAVATKMILDLTKEKQVPTCSLTAQKALLVEFK